jgi:hypothetical protein
MDKQQKLQRYNEAAAKSIGIPVEELDWEIRRENNVGKPAAYPIRKKKKGEVKL